jgi:hypothetical protein
VASGAAVQCACRHLTDFAGASKPALPVCTLANLTALQPRDIFTKLRLLFILVASLFAALVGGAAVGSLALRGAELGSELRAPRARSAHARAPPRKSRPRRTGQAYVRALVAARGKAAARRGARARPGRLEGWGS